MKNTQQLDDAFLAMVADWRDGGVGCDEASFDAQARALFEYQFDRNEAYARFAQSCGFSRERPPASWRRIPAVPASAFKDAILTTFEVRRAQLEFRTSGTTADRSGKHFVERAALYEASLLAAFDRFMLPDRPLIRFLNLVPNPRLNRHSSLGYMVGIVSDLRGDGTHQFFLGCGDQPGGRSDPDRCDEIDVGGFGDALDSAVAADRKVCITGTAFALVALLEALEHRGRRFATPAGSRIMETGGFKGRTRAIAREKLYARLQASFGIAQESIVAEYGMTELLSQYYDDPQTRCDSVRVKRSPPWLRTLVVGPHGRELAPGEIGFLRHFDLANRSSVLAVQTEDLGYAVEAAGAAEHGIVLLGRELDTPPRGCSLDAEDLLRLQTVSRSERLRSATHLATPR